MELRQLKNYTREICLEFCLNLPKLQQNLLWRLLESYWQNFRETFDLPNNTSLQQLGRALALRRLLVSAGDISKLDAALGTVIAKYQASDEAFLQQVIEVGSRDLLLSFFKQIFSNELSQLEISMQLEDLFSGIGWVYQGKIQAKKALGILGSVGVEEVLDFPKLNLLRKSGISLKPVGLRSENPLFRDRR